MRKIYLVAVSFFCFTTVSFSQVTIAGSTGLDGTYTTLTNAGGAFAVLNAGASQAGNTITITITANLGESGDNSLGYKNWVKLSIIPSGNRIVSGNLSGSAVITLNGSQKVVIDGLNTGGNSLQITNSSTSNISTTATILLNGGTSDCKITNCTILGSSSGSVGTVPATGTVFLGGGGTGCDRDTVSNNNIGDDPAGTPSICIAAYSSSGVIVNNDCVIRSNNIYNWYSIFSSCNAINLGQNNSGWTIDLNKCYQTASRSGLSTGTYLRFIYINSTTGDGYTISNNIMGYSNPSGTGMLTNTGGKIAAMDITTGGTLPSSIQGNTVNNINWTTGDAALGFGTASSISFLSFAGIGNIGTSTGNTFGETTTAATPANGIYITSSTASTMSISSIYINAQAACSVQNNTIGSIAATGLATSPFFFYGIAMAGNFSQTTTNNTIGGSVANSISLGIAGTTTAITNVFAVYTGSGGSSSAVTIGTAGAGNTIRNISSNGSGFSNFYGVYNASTPGTLDINYNNFTANSMAGTGTYMLVYSQATPTIALNINNNNFLSATVSAATYSSTAAFIYNTGSNSATCAGSFSNNSFAGFSFTGAGSSGSFFCISNVCALASVTIDNNNFNNLSLKVSGPVYICNNPNATNTVSFSNNNINTGFAKTLSGNFLYGYNNQTASTGGTATFNNNDLSNMTVTGATFCRAILQDAGTLQVLRVINNTISNIGGGSNVAGIFTGGGASGSEISGNTVSGLSGSSGISQGIVAGGSTSCYNNIVSGASITGAGTFYGIACTSGTAVNIYKNKIYDLQVNNVLGTVIGIFVGGSTANSTVAIYNNLIGDLRTPSTNSPNNIGVTGINLSSSGINSNLDVSFNTVYLDATSSGTDFLTTGIYHQASTTSTTGRLTLRNNIIINASIYKGSGKTVAFLRSAGTANMLNNYSTASNNNIFYAGTPAGNNYIYADGNSNLQSMANYRTGNITAGTIHPRDVNSVTENVSFISTSGASANFLHVNTAIATQVESGGSTIAGITDDYDGIVRNLTTPDIGADEGNFIPVDLIGPVVSYTALASTACTSPRTLVSTITDATGVNTTSGTKPRIYFRKTSNTNGLGVTNTNTTDGWKYSEASNASSPFSFTIDHSLLFGGLAPGDVVEYFIVAQDLAGTPNTTIYTGLPAITPSTVALTAAAFAMSAPINSYTINTSSSLAGVAGGGQVCNAYSVGGSISGIYYTDASCNLIARVVPSGASPVSGSINTCVRIETATMFYNAEPYLVRHFDIEPTSGSSSARITLYVLQSEFDDYNLNCGWFPQLPTFPFDLSGIANLRITQCHGTYSTQPLPGYYSGTAELINPLDIDIVWNATNSWWEISFNVTSFSGFFIHTTIFGYPLSAQFISLSGKREGAVNILKWKVPNEQNIHGYELERSYDGQSFTSIGFVNSQAPGGNSAAELQYSFTDNNFTGDKQYYRLKQTAMDGRVKMSSVVLVKGSTPASLTLSGLFPNPASSIVNVMIESPVRNELTILLSDINGRVLQTEKIIAEKGTTIIPINTEQLAGGTYLIKLICPSGCEDAVRKFVKN